MKAVGYKKSLPIDAADALIDFETVKPQPAGISTSLDAEGNVVHKFPPEKWQSWNDRFQKNEEYDWHRHRGQTTKPAVKKV